MVAPRAAHQGGITRAVQAWLDSGLAEHVDVDVVSLASWDDPLLRQLLQTGLGLLKLTARLLRPSRRPDVVHVHASSGGSMYRKYLASCLARAAGVPVLVHLHSGGFADWIATRRLHRATAERLIGSATGVVVIAEVWRGLALELGARCVYVIPHLLPVQSAQALSGARVARGATRGPSRHVTVLYYGRWAPIKGLDVLAQAVRRLPALRQQRLRVRVFGNGDVTWARACFSDTELADLTIGGWLSDERKPHELSMADAVLVPSRSEGFGASLLESMAAGTPIIASDAGAIPEVLAGYPMARLTARGDPDDLRDALEALVDGRWPDTPAGSPTLPERYSPARVIPALLDAYRLTLQRAGDSDWVHGNAREVQSPG
jgi:glycosyltransferase involved in cell wall biosynthesis